jgi:hypothetical protein
MNWIFWAAGSLGLLYILGLLYLRGWDKAHSTPDFSAKSNGELWGDLVTVNLMVTLSGRPFRRWVVRESRDLGRNGSTGREFLYFRRSTALAHAYYLLASAHRATGKKESTS